METYVAADGRRRTVARLRLVSDTAGLSKAQHSRSASRETDERVRFLKAVAIALLPSATLWALIWYTLTRLISNWP